ncbi:MAG: D-Ornithine 4,5-aminomutase S subunit [Candidatus Ozemobacter sibiricus]|jgi:D-ornithine 4,5-aminomutase subunit alpha|uniref:D-Ornithine 4,5-aminomutase S subunit n=1 Tax=Candidatus Ozemobacter sibiricus TaxID=2268124 RepID=A0A367ZJX9_9BACT|nr:MAG: D-Ornithine 4,5-aminomutase S subunit [Candidatus Ozemobacter sibiricus]
MTDTERIKKFEERRAALRALTDDQLKARFWDLCQKVVEPLVELARTHTSPSIERAVLLRMGIDSVTTKGVVSRVQEAGLLGKGAGHVVLKVSEKYKTDLRGAARKIVDDPACLNGLFRR